MRGGWRVGAVVVLLAAALAAAAPREVVVAPGGSDLAPGTTAQPLATLAAAQQAVRRLRATPGPITVTLRGGPYPQNAPLVFTPADSGRADSPVTWRSAPGERAVISGGRSLPGPWRPVAGKPYWELAVPRLDGAPWRFNSLFVNGQSRERARTPNWGEKVRRAEGRAPGEDERRAFRYRPGDLDPRWTNLTDADLVLLCSWTPTIHRIGEVLAEPRVVRFESSHERAVDFWEQRFRYYVANVFEALDAPGEWYLNRRTETLYYYPLPGEELATAEVVAPVLANRLVEFRGEIAADRWIEHLRFEGLEFRHTDADLDRFNGQYRQGHMFLDAAVYAEGLRQSRFTACEFAQLGQYALELGPGCRDNRVERCHFQDLGAGALQIGVTDLSSLMAVRLKPQPGDLVLEAEAATVTAPMQVERDEQAAGQACVALPTGAVGGACEFTVNLAAAARYRLYARVLAPSGTADSFEVQINDGPRQVYDTGVARGWFSSPVVARELQGKPVVAALGAGRNRVRLMGREAGIKLDQLILRPVGEADLEREGPGEAEVLRNVVDNNLIHRLGTIWHGCYGIVNRFASETRLTHNEIFDTHWTAIGLDARWNYGGERWSHGNEVAYNHLHHLGLGYHADAGAIYQFGPLDTHIHHNYIHHTRAYPYICGYAAVYLDEQSRGALVEQNLAHDIDWYAYFQHKGVDNVFRNNLGAFARDGFFYRGALNEQWRTNTCEVRGNIYLADDGVAIKQAWEPGLVPPVLRDNLYFSTTGTPLTFAGKSLAQWQAAGQDQGSVVADPGCRDAQGRDFRLAPTTAIQSIGFVPFDEAIATAGLYGDEAWRALPARLPRRQPTAVWSPAELARLQAFELDFEHLPEGAAPAELRLTREGEATFQVTAEQAASGRRALKCTDRKGLKKPFYPYLMLTSQGYGPARLRFCFDTLLPATSPAAFYTELRGTGGLHQVGPSLHFQRDGRLLANGRELARLKLGQWVRVEIELQTGPNAPRQYQLLVRQGDREERQTLNYHANFQDLGWLGICASEDADGTFYLDNLEFTID